MKAARIAGVGACAVGMPDWRCASEVLCGTRRWQPDPLPKLDAPLLPTAERRRVSPAARLAMTAAVQAIESCPEARRASIASVFATADGDGEVLASTLAALASDASAMSPTLFHNSVFNAPAGYWSIANRSRARSTTVSAGHGSFAAGLLEASIQVAAEGEPVLLVASDMPFPVSLSAFGIDGKTFACALLLAPDADATLPSLGAVRVEVRADVDARADASVDPAMAAAFDGNPASRALPLLAAIARAMPAVIHLPYVDGVCVEVGYAA